jgi:hypothetical protein
MGKATRTLAMAGMALIAGVTVGAGPAMASAPSASAPSATVSTQVAVKQVQSRDRVVGYYRTLRSCDHAGRLGERRGRWDSYDCSRVRHGIRRGWWSLEVQWGNHGNGGNNNGNGGHNNGGHGNGGHNNGGHGNGGHNNGGHGNGGHNDGGHHGGH